MEFHLPVIRMMILLLSAGLTVVTCEPEPVDTNNESSHSELKEPIPAAIQLSYDTGEGNDRAFRHEERIPNGGVKGSYGYYDENGNLVVRHYIADENGYRIVKEERRPLSSRKETEFNDNLESKDQLYEPNNPDSTNYSSIFHGSDSNSPPKSTDQRNDHHNANHKPDSTHFQNDFNDRNLPRKTPEVANFRNDFYDNNFPPTIPFSINRQASRFHDGTKLYDNYHPIQQESKLGDELHGQLSRHLNNDEQFPSPYYNRGGDIFNDGYQQSFPAQLPLQDPQQRFLDFASIYYPSDTTHDRIAPVNGFQRYHPFGNNENNYFKDSKNDNQYDFNINYNPRYDGNYNRFRSYILKHPFNTQRGQPQLRPTATNLNIPDVPKGKVVGVKLDSGKIVPLYKNYILSNPQRKPELSEPFHAFLPIQQSRKSHQRPNIFPLPLTPIVLQPEIRQTFLSDQPLFHNDFLYTTNKQNTAQLRKPLQTNFRPFNFDYYFPEAPSLSNDSRKISYRPSFYGSHYSLPPQLGFGNIYGKRS
ncbi:uncharacterized protein LOC143254199 [Tachypleus tridentatus]|uniref:uncharacterized protein LOC143254199 n=1 Tax=Tachypleus tridentatus TaxID=6853 RepID=UPI003FD06E58